MNYVIIRRKHDFVPLQTVPIISFECSYGLENDSGSNDFSVKIAESEGIIELGSFVQFGAHNERSISYQYVRTAKTDWCGKILNRDIDLATGVVTYTGVSLIGTLNNFVPVRDTEKITSHNVKALYNGQVYSTLSAIPSNIITAGLSAMATKFGNMTTQPVAARLNTLRTKANYPIYVEFSRETGFGTNSKPTNFDSDRKTWNDKWSAYTDYQFGSDPRTDYFEWFYCDNGYAYDRSETIPSSARIYFSAYGYDYVTELNHQSGVMDSIQDALLTDSELRVTIQGNTPTIIIYCRHPLKDDYIYIHKSLGMKIFSAMPYTAMAKGVEEDGPSYFDTVLYQLASGSGTSNLFGYYDLVYHENWGFGNDESWNTSPIYQFSWGGNIHMLKEGDFDYQQVWKKSRENIEKLSHEITFDGVADPDYILQHEYVFLFPQEFPEKLLSEWSVAGEHAMKMRLKNKRIVADAYTSKVTYNFYPNITYSE